MIASIAALALERAIVKWINWFFVVAVLANETVPLADLQFSERKKRVVNLLLS